MTNITGMKLDCRLIQGLLDILKKTTKIYEKIGYWTQDS